MSTKIVNEEQSSLWIEHRVAQSLELEIKEEEVRIRNWNE